MTCNDVRLLRPQFCRNRNKLKSCIVRKQNCRAYALSKAITLSNRQTSSF